MKKLNLYFIIGILLISIAFSFNENPYPMNFLHTSGVSITDYYNSYVEYRFTPDRDVELFYVNVWIRQDYQPSSAYFYIRNSTGQELARSRTYSNYTDLDNVQIAPLNGRYGDVMFNQSVTLKQGQTYDIYATAWRQNGNSGTPVDDWDTTMIYIARVPYIQFYGIELPNDAPEITFIDVFNDTAIETDTLVADCDAIDDGVFLMDYDWIKNNVSLGINSKTLTPDNIDKYDTITFSCITFDGLATATEYNDVFIYGLRPFTSEHQQTDVVGVVVDFLVEYGLTLIALVSLIALGGLYIWIKKVGK